MSQTIEENVRFVHEWSLDRIQYLYSEDGGNCEKMLDATEKRPQPAFYVVYVHRN